MKNYLFLPLFTMSVTVILAQPLPKWYSMVAETDVAGGWCVYSTEVSNGTESERYIAELEFIENPVVSTFNISRVYDSTYVPKKDKLFGLRGKIGANEVLVVDSDFDHSMLDEQVIFLPDLIMDKSMEYDQRFNYISDLNQNYALNYEYLIDGAIHQKNTNLGVRVHYKYDSLSQSIFYEDIFRVCFNQKLVFSGRIDGAKVRISSFDLFPWFGFVDFTLDSRDFHNKRVPIKTKFKTKEGGNPYTIDSIDFINNKILIAEVFDEKKLYVSGESLFSDEMVNTDSMSRGIKILHVWGSWCRPCVENLPKLIGIPTQFPGVEMIGLVDDRSKVPALKVAKDHGMEWKNIYFNMKEHNQLDELHINSFPTYIVTQDNIEVDRFFRVEELVKYLKTIPRP